MSLNWNFKTDKVGTWKVIGRGKDFTFNLYSGNALLIMLNEYEKDGEELYELASFFADKEHMKNCLGLNKGYNNIFQETLLEVTLLQSYRHTPMIVQHLAKAKFDNPIKITIEQSLPW